MVVEFVGPAAAGKSTLVRAVADRIRQEGVAVRLCSASGWIDPSEPFRRLKRLNGQAASMIRQPMLAAWAVPNVGGRRRTNRLLTSIRRADLARRAMRSEDGLLLLDEGPWRVAPRMIGEGVLFRRWLFSALPWPDLFVVVTVDPEIGIQRHRARHADDDLMRSPELMRQNHTAQITGLMTVITHRPHVTIDTTDGADHSRRVAAEIMVRLANRLTTER